MLTKKILTLLAAASLTCLTAANAWAQTAVVGSTTSTTSGSRLPGDALVSRYTLLAGSKTNAQSLVTGLRTGSVVTLAATGSAPAVSFTPATQKMGYGNIKIALTLAKTALAKQGITNPTPAQLAAALNGGSITLTNGTVVTMTGILTQRSAGMGWGKIAQTGGVKLGTVVSASKNDKDSNKEIEAKIEKIEKIEKTEKADKDNKKDILAKTENVKNHSDTSDAGNAKGSSHSGGGNSSSHGGGGKSSGGGSSNSGGNGGGGGGGNGGGGGGNSGGKK